MSSRALLVCLFALVGCASQASATRPPEALYLSVEVREHDPRLALDGGPDGLAPYRIFARSLRRLLAPGGFIVFEIGAGQKPDVVAMMAAGGLELQASRYDLGGHERALIFAPA